MPAEGSEGTAYTASYSFGGILSNATYLYLGADFDVSAFGINLPGLGDWTAYSTPRSRRTP